MDIVLLLIGVAGLWIGTEFTIGGALTIAKRHNLSEIFVGLVVLSIGSDLPEIAVAIDASLKTLGGEDASGVVTGSAIGSVVAQISFVLGIAGVISYLTLPRRFIFRHGAMLLGATVLLFLAAWDGRVSRVEGLSLITVYVIYVFTLLVRESAPEEVTRTLGSGKYRPWILLVLGLGIVIGGSEIAVQSVVNLARTWGISETVISVLVIGVGTSLPELSISLGAILRKKVHLSVGNIIGSNIFDTLVPISLAALITPLTFSRQLLMFDLPFAILLTLIVLAFFTRARGMQRREAIVVLSLYGVYVACKLMQL
jgi:cation:H+ antiporter